MVEKKKSLKHSNLTHSSDSLSLTILKNVFFKKQSKNPSYSLRAFAKSLNVSHTALSLIFSGKRKLNSKLVGKIVDKLDLTFRQRKLFLSEYAHSKNSEVSNLAEEAFHSLNEDQFALIAEWQHYAILSLIELKDFKMDYSWISKRIGISPLLAKSSVERLFRLKLLAKDSKGKWYQPNGYIRFNNKASTAATRKFHKQLIKKAYESLNDDPFHIRNHSSITFAMNPKDIPYAIEKLKEFRFKFSDELSNMSSKEEVYNLCLQLYPVSRRPS